MARIALDIDSTLHHYWDLLQRIAHERYGVDLPYEEQRDWGITVLERDAIVHCVEESHSDENIAAGVPYPQAVETVRDWHDAGHWIHVTSHRRRSTYEATPPGSTRSACPGTTSTARSTRSRAASSSASTCSWTTARSTSPRRATPGIVAATIIHPWNEEAVRERRRHRGPDWQGLRAALDPVLERLDSAPA